LQLAACSSFPQHLVHDPDYLLKQYRAGRMKFIIVGVGPDKVMAI
jgi:hypothetical protein